MHLAFSNLLVALLAAVETTAIPAGKADFGLMERELCCDVSFPFFGFLNFYAELQYAPDTNTVLQLLL